MPSESLSDRLGDAASRVRGTLTESRPLAPLIWFRAGGPAEYLFEPADEDDLAAFLAALPPDIPVTVTGLGSNLLVRDGGVPGVVIRLPQRGFGGIEALPGNRLAAGAAVADRRLSIAAHEAGLGGFAFLFGIPGAVGGALRMNAGANGTETAARLVEARAVDRRGKRHTLSLADMGFSYRHAAAADDLIFTGAVFEGVPADRAAIRAEMDAVAAHRDAAQPVKSRTGGSTFRNPPGDSAWKLVDAAGCRGLTIGDAQVSPMHTNFLINRGSATAHDIELLGETVRARVLATSGIALQWEIVRIGAFAPGQVVEPFCGAGPPP